MEATNAKELRVPFASPVLNLDRNFTPLAAYHMSKMYLFFLGGQKAAEEGVQI